MLTNYFTNTAPSQLTRSHCGLCVQITKSNSGSPGAKTIPSNGVRLMEFDSFLQISFVVETLSF